MSEDQTSLFDEIALKIWGRSSDQDQTVHVAYDHEDNLLYFQQVLSNLISESGASTASCAESGRRLRTIHQQYEDSSCLSMYKSESSTPTPFSPSATETRIRPPVGLSGRPAIDFGEWRVMSSGFVWLLAGTIFGIIFAFLAGALISRGRPKHDC